jgi:hypothetical protein
MKCTLFCGGKKKADGAGCFNNAVNNLGAYIHKKYVCLGATVRPPCFWDTNNSELSNIKGSCCLINCG